MIVTAALIGGFVLDLILGDPAWVPHPVVIIGKFISLLESFLRKVLPKTNRGELIGGSILVLLIISGTFTVTFAVCLGAFLISPILGFLVQTLWCWQALSVKGLGDEGKNVYASLADGENIEFARKAVGRIVGRDTQDLDRKGIIKATVETIAENFSDGVTAPMFYIMLGGAPLGLTYKAVNTMDSMLGYKNEKYLYFGRAAAKTDDLLGYIPSRLGALFFIAAAAIKKLNAKEAFRVWKRDHRNHVSPNSAQTESACAGALEIQLAGPAYYFGEFYDKPTIGDCKRQVEREDILKTRSLMYAASFLAAVCFAVVSAAFFII